MNIKDKIFGYEDLEKEFGVMTLGRFVRAFRQAEGISQTAYAAKLGLSRANLCDLEKDRKPVSPERAAKLAKKLGVPESVLLRLSIQDALRAAKLNYIVEIKKAC